MEGNHNTRILLMCHSQGLTYCIDILGIAPVDMSIASATKKKGH